MLVVVCCCFFRLLRSSGFYLLKSKSINNIWSPRKRANTKRDRERKKKTNGNWCDMKIERNPSLDLLNCFLRDDYIVLYGRNSRLIALFLLCADQLGALSRNKRETETETHRLTREHTKTENKISCPKTVSLCVCPYTFFFKVSCFFCPYSYWFNSILTLVFHHICWGASRYFDYDI